MTILKLTSMAAVMAIAVGAASLTNATTATTATDTPNTATANGDTATQTPDQRAMKLALSLTDQAAGQRPKTAVLARSSARNAPAALAAGVATATQGAKK